MKKNSSLKNLYRKSLFDASLVGFIFNPSFIVRSALYRIISKLSPQFANMDILDVGCGSKPYRDHFASARSYQGIDTNSSGHDHSQESIDVLYDGITIPYGNESYDAVVSFQVLEHVLNEEIFLNEIGRVLKADGLVLMSIPFTWPEHEQPYDFRRFTSFGVEEVLRKHGFEILEITKTTNFPQTILQMTSNYFSNAFKTKFTILNLVLLAIYNPFINLFGFIASASKDYDLFCDIVVTARKKKLFLQLP